MLRRAPRPRTTRRALWRSGSLKQVHLARSNGFRLAVFQSEEQPPGRIDSAHRALANDISQLVGHTDETPLEHRMLGELARKRCEPAVAPATIQGLELVENRIANGIDRSFALAGEPEAKIGQIRRRVLPADFHRVLGRLDVHADSHAYPARMDLRGDAGKLRVEILDAWGVCPRRLEPLSLVGMCRAQFRTTRTAQWAVLHSRTV